MSSPINNNTEKKELDVPVIGEPASRTVTEVETLAGDEPQPIKAAPSDIEKAESSRGKNKPGAGWKDAEVQDPLTRIFDLLSEKKDRTLIQNWIGWLVKKDSERALKVSGPVWMTDCGSF